MKKREIKINKWNLLVLLFLSSVIAESSGVMSYPNNLFLIGVSALSSCIFVILMIALYRKVTENKNL